MEAWLGAHALNPVKRPVWVPELVNEERPPSPSRPPRRSRTAEAMRHGLRELIELLGPRELEQLATFAEFLRARRASEAGQQPSSPEAAADAAQAAAASSPEQPPPGGEDKPSSKRVPAKRKAASE
jgi:hypothetical protein